MSLGRFEPLDWQTTDKDVSEIGDALDEIKHYPIVGPAEARRLELVDRDVFRAGMLVAKKAGLFKAERKA